MSEIGAFLAASAVLLGWAGFVSAYLVKTEHRLTRMETLLERARGHHVA